MSPRWPEIVPSTEKHCGQCDTTKPISAFGKDRHKRDGLTSVCKVCAVKSRSASYYRNKDRPDRKLAKRLYSQRPEQRAAIALVQKRLKEKYPERFKARTALNNAIKRGKMKRGDCQVCGVPNAHAHHHDYSKPFDVEWFCRACHADIHRAERGTPATGMRKTG